MTSNPFLRMEMSLRRLNRKNIHISAVGSGSLDEMAQAEKQNRRKQDVSDNPWTELVEMKKKRYFNNIKPATSSRNLSNQEQKKSRKR